MLSRDDLRQLDRLVIGDRRAASSAAASGARVSHARGIGTDFHDFTRYQAGDDPRSIEWTIYGRLGQLVTRTYRADAHLRMHLLVDVSRSMSIGAPSKLSCALKLAAALGYVAASSGDAVGLTTFDHHIAHRLAPVTGRSHLLRVLTALEGAAPMGASAISTALMQYGVVERGPGLALVISDYLDPAGAFEGLRWLLERGLTPAVAQILSPEEIDPLLSHDTELVDIEDPTASPLVIDAAAIAAYKRALVGLRTSLREFCSANGLSCIEINSSDSFTDLLRTCERAGILVRQA